MRKKTLVAVAVAGALSVLAAPVVSGAVIDHRATDVVAVGADPLLAVERNRSGIIERLVAEHRSALLANAIAESAFRNALASLRADQLLAASLVNSLQEVSAIVAAPPAESSALSRYVAVAPTSTLAALPQADAYLVRDGESLSVVKAAQLQLNANIQLVGYFVAGSSSTVAVAGSGTGYTPKDGSGSGANSWIGYVAGSNNASGLGSAIAAGTFNTASGQNSFVGAGQSNVASGISSLVIGGFDNQATVIDAMVGAGAGNRATGARSIVVGGGYNLASGPWSFIGGGGRQTGGGAAGANAEDHIASGGFSTIAGGQGNRATGFQSTVSGGGYNQAISNNATVGGGGSVSFPNLASGGWSTISGGAQNAASGQSSTVAGGFLNVASGDRAFAVGFSNIASGAGSVALGYQALTQDTTPTPHQNAFVFSDGSSGNFRSTAANTFSVLATGGFRFVPQATNTAGEAAAAQTVNITPAGELTFPEEGRQQIRMRTASSLSQGMGGQTSTTYFRTNSAFGWYAGGIHSDAFLDAGTGGTILASLTNGASASTVTGTFRAQVITATSDRNAKTDFVSLNARTILAKVAQMPIATWSYKNEAGDGIRHIGPVAQDFKQLFNVGYDDKSIATVDADGVAFAAIKGLVEEARERDALIDLQRAQLSAQQQRIASLEQQWGELAATQLQMQDMAQLVLKLQQEMALLRQPREIALAPR